MSLLQCPWIVGSRLGLTEERDRRPEGKGLRMQADGSQD